MPEVVVNGLTGFICNTVHGMVEAVDRVGSLERAACRAHVERHFSPSAIADGYERAYAALFGRGADCHGVPTQAIQAPLVAAPR